MSLFKCISIVSFELTLGFDSGHLHLEPLSSISMVFCRELSWLLISDVLIVLSQSLRTMSTNSNSTEKVVTNFYKERKKNNDDVKRHWLFVVWLSWVMFFFLPVFDIIITNISNLNSKLLTLCPYNNLALLNIIYLRNIFVK